MERETIIKIVLLAFLTIVFLVFGIKGIYDNEFNENCINSEVEVTILGVEHSDKQFLQTETYETIVRLDDEIFYINDKDTYYKYKDKINETVEATQKEYSSKFFGNKKIIELS